MSASRLLRNSGASQVWLEIGFSARTSAGTALQKETGCIEQQRRKTRNGPCSLTGMDRRDPWRRRVMIKNSALQFGALPAACSLKCSASVQSRFYRVICSSCQRRHHLTSRERWGMMRRKRLPLKHTCSFVTVTSNRYRIKMSSAQGMSSASTSLGSFPVQPVISKRTENVTQLVNAYAGAAFSDSSLPKSLTVCKTTGTLVSVFILSLALVVALCYISNDAPWAKGIVGEKNGQFVLNKQIHSIVAVKLIPQWLSGLRENNSSDDSKKSKKKQRLNSLGGGQTYNIDSGNLKNKGKANVDNKNNIKQPRLPALKLLGDRAREQLVNDVLRSSHQHHNLPERIPMEAVPGTATPPAHTYMLTCANFPAALDLKNTYKHFCAHTPHLRRVTHRAI
ncbi:hypothetical protein IRJ41_017558 [Triplophysa rosa]|uniref:Uncharacterized protein n=1 Tax=Triplophysa rosa TaxID=992332 RepID=A0A9W7TTF8_TRIRA|nr:hypothetical protein IRJ41_017558 [Triplophysa rosa]